MQTHINSDLYSNLLYQADMSGNFNRVNFDGIGDQFFVEDTVNLSAKSKITQITLSEDEKYAYVTTDYEDMLKTRK